MYLRARKGLVLLPQEPSVFRKMTVAENLMAVLETRPSGAASRAARVSGALEEFGLGALAGSMALTLSGGERRRLEIARAMVLDPEFLLLDEPFIGQDRRNVLWMIERIREVADAGGAVALITHDIPLAAALADRILYLERGTWRVGTPGDIFAWLRDTGNAEFTPEAWS